MHLHQSTLRMPPSVDLAQRSTLRRDAPSWNPSPSSSSTHQWDRSGTFLHHRPTPTANTLEASSHARHEAPSASSTPTAGSKRNLSPSAADSTRAAARYSADTFLASLSDTPPSNAVSIAPALALDRALALHPAPSPLGRGIPSDSVSSDALAPSASSLATDSAIALLTFHSATDPMPGGALVVHPGLEAILSLTPSLANPPPAPTQLLAGAGAVTTVPTVLPAQPGLIVAPPPPSMRIVPYVEQKNAINKSPSNSKWYAIPMAKFCTVSQPILSTDPSVWQTYGEGCPNKGFGRTFTLAQGGYPAALAHILAHFSQKPQFHPEGICLNCFLIHHGTPCASPMYDWNLHIRATSHPACPSCGQQHFIGLPCPSAPPPSGQ